MARLDVELLETFVAIIEEGSFTKAGMRLNRTQPAISMQLKRLEQRVGRPLLHRHARTVDLTEAGRRLFEQAREIVHMSQSAFRQVSAPQVTGVLRLGVTPWIAAHAVGPVLEVIADQASDLSVEVSIAGSEALREQAQQGALDLALVWRQAGADEAYKVPLQWACAASLDPRGAASIPIISGQSASWIDRHASTLLADDGRAVHVVLSGDDHQIRIQAVRAGLGVALMPASALPSDLLSRSADLPSAGAVAIDVLDPLADHADLCGAILRALQSRLQADLSGGALAAAE